MLFTNVGNLIIQHEDSFELILKKQTKCFK